MDLRAQRLGGGLAALLLLGLGLALPWGAAPPQRRPQGAASVLPLCRRQGQRHSTVLIYGDEPAGIMTALELARRLPDLAGLRRPRITLLTEAPPQAGLGGTLVRSGLAYLDRNQVPQDMWGPLDPFAPSSPLYRRFLQLTGVRQIAVDRQQAARAFRRELRRAHVTVLTAADLQGAAAEQGRLCLVHAAPYGDLGADLFVDASLGGHLAHLAGVAFQSGVGSGPQLSRDSLALGWIFEVRGLTLQGLQAMEERLTARLLNPRDGEAQAWLRRWPKYQGHPHRLRDDLVDGSGRPKLAFSSTSDSADQQSPALALAFAGETGLPAGLEHAPAYLDRANIAILRDRLSFNALLFRNDANRNREVLARQGAPQPWMRPYAAAVTRFFLRHGARRVEWMPALYVRSADQIARPMQVLGAEQMARGGVDAAEALGTFTYALDFRGGLSTWLPPAKPTFNYGYRHTLPRELTNLAVLGPASGYGGPGEGAGRIMELNISVGQGLATAAALAVASHTSLAAIDPQRVARLTPRDHPPYGRPSQQTRLSLTLRKGLYLLQDLGARLLRGWPGCGSGCTGARTAT
jgi:hypothetical protein